MVGVPGKSRACHDCKRRRVKCDFRISFCWRCEKAGLSCQGYNMSPMFVNRTVTEPSATTSSVLSNKRLQRVCPTPQTPRSLHETFLGLKASAATSLGQPSRFRAQAWELLKELYLPRPQSTSDDDLRSTTPYSWLHAVCHSSLKSRVLDQSLLAFCAIQICITEPWSITVNEALETYSEALPELVQNIGDNQERQTDGTLAAIVVLSTCELFILPNDQSWRAHAHGISALLRQRGVIGNRSMMWLSLCSRLRVICVIIGLTKRERLALDPDTWRQLMGMENATDLFEKLMDLISEVPHLIEKSDEVLASGSEHLTLVHSLFQVYQQIEAWQQASRRGSENSAYWAIPSQLQNPADSDFADRLFPFALEFESLSVAIQIIFSSTVMLQLLSTVLLLLGKDDVPSSAAAGEEQHCLPEQDQVDSHRALNNMYDNGEEYTWTGRSIQRKAEKVARFLCQSIEYCLRPEMGTVGVQCTCRLQLVTESYFRQVGNERALEWCKNIKAMSGPGFRCGIKLMRFEHTNTL